MLLLAGARVNPGKGAAAIAASLRGSGKL
jgi:hypothetical protein